MRARALRLLVSVTLLLPHRTKVACCCMCEPPQVLLSLEGQVLFTLSMALQHNLVEYRLGLEQVPFFFLHCVDSISPDAEKTMAENLCPKR